MTAHPKLAAHSEDFPPTYGQHQNNELAHFYGVEAHKIGTPLQSLDAIVDPDTPTLRGRPPQWARIMLVMMFLFPALVGVGTLIGFVILHYNDQDAGHSTSDPAPIAATFTGTATVYVTSPTATSRLMGTAATYTSSPANTTYSRHTRSITVIITEMVPAPSSTSAPVQASGASEGAESSISSVVSSLDAKLTPSTVGKTIIGHPFEKSFTISYTPALSASLSSVSNAKTPAATSSARGPRFCSPQAPADPCNDGDGTGVH
ncbi:hypothetical protein LTR36_010564 [Oleoguttula mirabilis]|uniref:Uncharacterized protein n=1 Tax=Oleoguttula mirabilis TaxID=1507867 RepID=A0AAV9JTF0_9PEZI|nr:hypothetical protein LTR36_010564 [Oleoguttula mirabilis]